MRRGSGQNAVPCELRSLRERFGGGVRGQRLLR
jgi:hypothetical protein